LRGLIRDCNLRALHYSAGGVGDGTRYSACRSVLRVKAETRSEVDQGENEDEELELVAV
jgi:hypothetical protein